MNALDSIIRSALEEDLADRGDITTAAVIPEPTQAVGNLVTRDAGVVAGLEVAGRVFATVDPDVVFELFAGDGDEVPAGAVIARVSGSARSILKAERTALNLLGRMSGVATATSKLVAEVEGTGAVISDTRKTMPGLRLIDKQAVVAGGGVNHRMGLHDAVMIKDNHIAAAGDIAEAVSRARTAVGGDVMIVVEVENLVQLGEVLTTDADRVLLDNMDVATLREAVVMAGDSVVTEASGGITAGNVREVAQTGVDVISIGAITHSAPQLDIALDFSE